MSFLAKAAPKKEVASLRKMLHARLTYSQPARSTKILHASEVTKGSSTNKFCPREYALLGITKKKRKDERLFTAQTVVFRMGRDLEVFVRDSLVDVLYGRWRCAACGSKTDGISKHPSYDCPECKRGKWEYVETRSISALSGISCGLDALIYEGTGKLRVVEIKSIDKEVFKTLKGPLAEHRVRTRLYLRCIAEDKALSHMVHSDAAVVLYVSKGGYGKMDPIVGTYGTGEEGNWTPFQEFVVEREDEQVQELVDRALLVKQFRDTGLIPKGVCDTQMCTRAANCTVSKECFSGKFKPGSVFKEEKDDA